MKEQTQPLSYAAAPIRREAAPPPGTAPDEPTRADRTVPMRSPIKILKRFVRRRLFKLAVALNDCSAWIQRRYLRTTLARDRCENNLNLPLESMDQDMLGMYIRWNGHHVEKTVRYERTQGRGSGKPILLRNASILPIGARAIAVKATLRAVRWTKFALKVSAASEHDGQPCSHSGPNMKW